MWLFHFHIFTTFFKTLVTCTTFSTFPHLSFPQLFSCFHKFFPYTDVQIFSQLFLIPFRTFQLFSQLEVFQNFANFWPLFYLLNITKLFTTFDVFVSQFCYCIDNLPIIFTTFWFSLSYLLCLFFSHKIFF